MKLLVDISRQWLTQSISNFRLWLALIMLAVPLGILAQLQGIRGAYLDPGFAGLAANPPMQSAILTLDGRPQALEFYLAEVLSSQWPVTASYEEVSRLVLQEEDARRELWVSFF